MPDAAKTDDRPGLTPAQWLLARADPGAGLTKTFALQRVVVREAATRWPEWWNHELFGPPHRETELPVLEATHLGLRRLRLVRRRRETLHTTARGRELLADPDALAQVLYEGLAEDDLDELAWPMLEAELLDGGVVAATDILAKLTPVLMTLGLRDDDGAPLDVHGLWHFLGPLLARAEGFGLLERHLGEGPLGLSLTETGRSLVVEDMRDAPGGHLLSPEELMTTTLAQPGDAAVVFDAELISGIDIDRIDSVGARVAVLERQPLTALHDAIQVAFGWLDDHLYSFFLDGKFWSDDAEITSPLTPDHGPPTADVPLAELDLSVRQRIAYIFDFGDEWRVRLKVRERSAGDGAYPRVLEVRGTPPPQYPALDED